VRGVKSGIKAQILAACRDAIRLLAFQRAFELRTMDEMRDFVAEHELPVNTSVRGSIRGVQASVKAQILVALHATYSQHFVAGHGILMPPLPPKHVPLPRTLDRLIVVLDMDECLVHTVWSDTETNEQTSAALSKFALSMRGDDRRPTVNLRPGLEPFLRALCTDPELEVHIFTAGTESYAAPLLDTLEGLLHVSLPRRHFRSACTVRNEHYMKDLSTITGRGDNLARVVLVDNSSTSFVPQPDNGIPIVDFLADPCDSALAPILTLINELKSQEDVRPVLVRRFGLAETLGPLRAQIDGGDQNPRETFSHGSRLCVD
jgi:hypothetical protein